MADSAHNNPSILKGMHIRALAIKSSNTTGAFAGSYFLFTSDFGPRGLYVRVQRDAMADETVVNLDTSEYIWIYSIGIDPSGDFPMLSIVHVEKIPADQMPRDDGVYRVGIDIAPGWWKATEDATTAQSCYWARSNSNGEIIANLFGYGGTRVYVATTDYAVEFSGCGVMVYLGK